LSGKRLCKANCLVLVHFVCTMSITYGENKDYYYKYHAARMVNIP